jgi:hypothetical protein
VHAAKKDSKTMKPKNFPAKKLRRQLIAKKENLDSDNNKKLLENAREDKTKKDRRK